MVLTWYVGVAGCRICPFSVDDPGQGWFTDLSSKRLGLDRFPWERYQGESFEPYGSFPSVGLISVRRLGGRVKSLDSDDAVFHGSVGFLFIR